MAVQIVDNTPAPDSARPLPFDDVTRIGGDGPRQVWPPEPEVPEDLPRSGDVIPFPQRHRSDS